MMYIIQWPIFAAEVEHYNAKHQGTSPTIVATCTYICQLFLFGYAMSMTLLRL